MQTELNKELISNVILTNKQIIKGFGVLSLALFGSYTRNQQDADSDIDFLVKFNVYKYRNYSGLRDFLQETFKRKIDLVCENSLNEKIKSYILADSLWLVN